MKKIKSLYIKHSVIINYLLFGGLTTIVNFIVFYIVSKIGINVLLSNILAWFFAVLFAYFTNKKYVFNSKTESISCFLKELISFFGCRIFSLVLEEIILYVCVNLLNYNEYLIKIITQIIVIVINYIFSKIFIFRKNERNIINEKNINNYSIL